MCRGSPWMGLRPYCIELNWHPLFIDCHHASRFSEIASYETSIEGDVNLPSQSKLPLFHSALPTKCKIQCPFQMGSFGWEWLRFVFSASRKPWFAARTTFMSAFGHTKKWYFVALVTEQSFENETVLSIDLILNRQPRHKTGALSISWGRDVITLQNTRTWRHN